MVISICGYICTIFFDFISNWRTSGLNIDLDEELWPPWKIIIFYSIKIILYKERREEEDEWFIFYFLNKKNFPFSLFKWYFLDVIYKTIYLYL